MAYISDIFQEAAGRDHGPWTLLLVPGSVIILVIRAIIFSISAILTFRVSTSAGADVFYFLSF